METHMKDIRKMWNVAKYVTKYELVKVPSKTPTKIISSIIVILQRRENLKISLVHRYLLSSITVY